MNRSSIFWSAVRNWVPRLGTILTFFVLARILDRAEIGLFAAAFALISLTELFADNGFGDAVVRNRDLPRGIVMTLLIINVGVAVVIYLGLTLFSDELSGLFNVTGFGPVLQLVGLSLIINSLGYVPQALLRRDFQFKRLAYRSLVSTLAGAATGLVMAFLGAGVYAMVGQLLVTTTVNTVFLWYPLVLKPAAPQIGGMGEVLRFSLGVFGSRVLGFAAGRMIELAIPIFFGPVALAQFIMGSRVPAVLAQMLTAVMVDVNLPHFSSLAHDPEALRTAFYKALRSLSLITTPIFIGLGALAPEVTIVAFGANGAGAEYMMLMITLLATVQAIGFTNDVVLTASGNTHQMVGMQVFAVLSIAISFLVFRTTNVEWLVTAYTACLICVILGGVIYSTRRTGVSLLMIVRTAGGFVAAALLGLAVVTFARIELGALVPFVFLRGAMLGVTFLAVYLGALALLDRPGLRQTLELGLSGFRRLRRSR